MEKMIMCSPRIAVNMQTRHLGATQRSFLYKVEIFRQRLKVLLLVPGCCEHTTRHLGATKWKSFYKLTEERL